MFTALLKNSLISIFLLLISTSISASSYKVGQTASDFSLKDLDGKLVTLKELLKQGHVLLVFWETECVYCYLHISDLNKIQETYKDKGLTVVAVNFLGQHINDIRDYKNTNNVQYLMLGDTLNSIDVAQAYRVIGSPTIILISPEGKILFYDYDVPDLTQWFND